jgi:hypothetical protein
MGYVEKSERRDQVVTIRLTGGELRAILGLCGLNSISVSELGRRLFMEACSNEYKLSEDHLLCARQKLEKMDKQPLEEMNRMYVEQCKKVLQFEEDIIFFKRGKVTTSIVRLYITNEFKHLEKAGFIDGTKDNIKKMIDIVKTFYPNLLRYCNTDSYDVLQKTTPNLCNMSYIDKVTKKQNDNSNEKYYKKLTKKKVKKPVKKEEIIEYDEFKENFEKKVSSRKKP